MVLDSSPVSLGKQIRLLFKGEGGSLAGNSNNKASICETKKSVQRLLKIITYFELTFSYNSLTNIFGKENKKLAKLENNKNIWYHLFRNLRRLVQNKIISER